MGMRGVLHSHIESIKSSDECRLTWYVSTPHEGKEQKDPPHLLVSKWGGMPFQYSHLEGRDLVYPSQQRAHRGSRRGRCSGRIGSIGRGRR